MPAGRPISRDVRLWAATALTALAALALGCYNPQIADGGFVCATSGKACPDGFACGADHRCSRSPVTTPPTDAGQGADSGGEHMCSSPPVTALCQAPPPAGKACNPACQTGCDCGRCNVVGDAPACVPSGAKALGEICTAGDADNCAPGLICLLEACGNGLARCYRHCTVDAQCTNTICTIPIENAQGADTGFKTCDVPPQTCDPINNTGCPDPALNCYLTSNNLTLCDCPSNPNPTQQGMNNASCTIYSDCAPGFVCISNVNGLAGPHCHFACNLMRPSCPSKAGVDGGVATATSCVPTGNGSMYGYCGM